MRVRTRSTHVSRYGDGGSVSLLGEGDDTGDGGVSLEDSDSLYGWMYGIVMAGAG